MSDTRRLDTRLLFAFAATYEEGSISRAAERLGLTQQGLSGSIARLRELMGDPLFVRQGHGVVSTPAADKVYPRVLQALQALDNVLDADAFSPDTAEGTILIAAADYAIATVVLPLIRALPDVAPGLSVAVQSFLGEIGVSDKRLSSVDFVLTVPELMPRQLHTKVLFSDRYILTMRRDHPLAASPVSLDAFCMAEHLLVSPHEAVRFGVTDAALAALGRSRNVRLVVPTFSLTPKILSETDLVAVLPERLIKDFPETLVIQEPPLDLKPFEIAVGWPDRLHQSEMHKWIRETLRIYVGDR